LGHTCVDISRYQGSGIRGKSKLFLVDFAQSRGEPSLRHDERTDVFITDKFVVHQEIWRAYDLSSRDMRCIPPAL